MDNIITAIIEQLKLCLSIKGRINRRTYLANTLMILTIFTTGSVYAFSRSYSSLVHSIGIILLILGFLWEFAVTTRRAHDFNQPLWIAFIQTALSILPIWYIQIAPFTWIMRLIMLIIPGSQNANKYGEKPESKIII